MSLLLCALALALPPQTKAPPVDATAGELSVSGGTLYYETAGSGPAVILIHGGFGDRRMWDAQFAAFTSAFRVVRYDHRGFGRSPVPQGPYSPVDDLLRLMDRLSIRRAHLVGNSLGGSLAIDFAHKHPDRVASLVIVASGARGYPAPQKDIDRVVAVFKAAEAEGREKAAEMWLAHPMVAVSSSTPGVREQLRVMVRENTGVFLMKHWPSEPMEPMAAKRLNEIRVPTLIIIGGRDTEINRKMGEETARNITGAKTVVMPGGDHLPQMVNPSRFNRHVLEFWRSL